MEASYREACAARRVKPSRTMAEQLSVPDASCLSLRHSVVTDGHAAVLASMLTQMPHLVAVDVSAAELSYVALGHVCRALTSLAQSHPHIELHVSERHAGPRSLRHLRALATAHPGAAVTGFDIGIFNAVEVPLVAEPEDAELVVRHVDDEIMGTDDETVLINRIASQLERLMAPVQLMHDTDFIAASGAMLSDHAVALAVTWGEYADLLDSTRAAMRFENPFRPPVHHPEGFYCSPLPAHGRASRAYDDEAGELMRLKAKLFITEDALRRRCEAIGDETSIGLDGRLCRPYRVRATETIRDIARRFQLTIHDVVVANPKLRDVDHFSLKLDGVLLAIPVAPEVLLADQLVHERAQALRVAECRLSVRDAERRHDDAAADAAAAEEELCVQRLDDLTATREATQHQLRDIEHCVYQKKRDGRLRFLREQQALVDERLRRVVAALADHSDGVDALIRRSDIEIGALRGPVEDAADREIRLLKLRCSEHVKMCRATDVVSAIAP
jgi:hypothetical protein